MSSRVGIAARPLVSDTMMPSLSLTESTRTAVVEMHFLE